MVTLSVRTFDSRLGRVLEKLYFSKMSGSRSLIYWIKWLVAYVAIRIRNYSHRRRFNLYNVNAFGDPVKLGYVIPQLEKNLESPFPEAHLQESSDEVLFYGVNSKSECLLVRVSREPNQEADAWIYLKLSNGKTYELAESVGYQQPYEEGRKCVNFSCSQLQMHYLLPMRRWRIHFCGMLREVSGGDANSSEAVFVKFVFLWKASSDVYDLTLETNARGFAEALAKAEWKGQIVPPLNDVVEATNLYAQSGVIQGTVSIDDGEEFELYLFGERMRNLGKKTNFADCKFTHIVGNTPGNGFTFHLAKLSVPCIFKGLTFGFVVNPDSTLKIMKNGDIKYPENNKEFEKEVTVNFIAGDDYEVSGQVIGNPIALSSGHNWRGFVEASIIEFTIGGKKGFGLVLAGKLSRKPVSSEKTLSMIPIPKNIPYTVQFTNEVSQLNQVSGGKGSSLGKLTNLSNKGKTFIVPKGIVVTTAAYEEFITHEILNSVKLLENVIYKNIKGDVKEAYDSLFKTMINTLLPEEIGEGIIKDLEKLFGSKFHEHTFAVRSSSTGEDTSSLSAAGQMDTFLGVKGIDEIFLAVKKCWASQFGPVAAEYKRRHGQPLNCPMAVVVQEMVSCEVSGVLFTCDPVTNNPSTVTVTANYGLGETVVSGTVEPDTITFKRSTDGNLQLCSVQIGDKCQKVVINESGGIVKEDLPVELRRETCLSTNAAKRLGNISLQIETYFKSSRDIEWGIVNENVYILQSRPVTNAAAMTEYELKHEMDSPMRCENEYYTIANVGEVMPGAASPLGGDLIFKYFGNVFKKLAVQKGNADNLMSSKYFASGMLLFFSHLMMTVADAMTRYGLDTPMSKGFMISLFGRILDDPDLVAFASEKAVPGQEPKRTFKQSIQYYWELFFHDWGTEKTKKIIDNYHLNFLKCDTAGGTFSALLNSCSDFDEAGMQHISSSESSSNWNMIVFQILKNANKGSMDSGVYADFSRLLGTSSGAESANAPQALKEVALQIVSDIDCGTFKSMPVEEALCWLQDSSTEAGNKFRQFLKRHGHRCLKESDMRSVTWAMDPTGVVKLLQNLAGVSDMNETKENDYGKLFSQLNVRLGFFSKCLLRRLVLPNVGRAIRSREAGKSLTMKSFDYWRQGFRRLSRQMVSEGRLPDPDLIFFLYLEEIQDLLETRSPSMVIRASHRQKILPILDNYKFLEIMRGMPKPVNENNESSESYSADLIMKGTPVSQGVTKGYARVALNLEDASQLKPGEILITHCTDIGWSPYFPIISGVVTEIGGLISHGAVVSREYGLPCVVGLQEATRRFRTGDYVLLDGKKGILQRLPQPNSS